MKKPNVNKVIDWVFTFFSIAIAAELVWYVFYASSNDAAARFSNDAIVFLCGFCVCNFTSRLRYKRVAKKHFEMITSPGQFGECGHNGCNAEGIIQVNGRMYCMPHALEQGQKS